MVGSGKSPAEGGSVRVGDLSRRSGVSVPTIKFYLRDGLLPPGELTSRNQAQYGEEHVRRLGIIRALLDLGGLSVAAVRDVLAVMDQPDAPLHKVLGAALCSMVPPATLPEDADVDQARQRLTAVAERRGWRTGPDNPSWRAAAEVLVTLQRLGFPRTEDWVEAYAVAAEQVAAADVEVTAGLPTREDTVKAVVVGTLLGDALFAALRRLAQEDASSRKYQGADVQ
jgi:DNA-binding transcriptional MerR regulator